MHVSVRDLQGSQSVLSLLLTLMVIVRSRTRKLRARQIRDALADRREQEAGEARRKRHGGAGEDPRREGRQAIRVSGIRSRFRVSG